ncbi:hypothetical protein VTI28DRAFT_5747 [Corynascus sepedonium]
MTSTDPPPTTQPPPAGGAPASSDAPLPEPNPFLHKAAIAMAILCPIALILPSRGGGRAKSTLQNAVLGAGGFWGVNQLAEDYTGKSITARSGERWGALLGVDSADKKETSDRKDGGKVGLMHNLPTERAARNKELMEAERRRRAEAEGKEYRPRRAADQTGSLWERLWMGGEKEGWKERRLEEERKAIESGKGYGGLIADQVMEVWRGKGGSDNDSDSGEGGKNEKGERKKE